MLLRIWRAPVGREARNEQRKLRGSLVNAVALTMIIAALVGIGGLAHLFAALLIRGIEDKA